MIVSDDYQSFAIFNYEDIQWYASTNQGGSPETGKGGEAAKVIFVSFITFNIGIHIFFIH
jgi:hypothetical protein